MTYFDGSFSTADFDQGMMDFIKSNFNISKHPSDWHISSPFLKYYPKFDYFWLGKTESGNILTKEQFKEKIGMGKEDTSDVNKNILKTGMIVEIEGQLSMVLLDTENGDILSGRTWGDLGSKLKQITKVYQPNNNLFYLGNCDLSFESDTGINKEGCTLIWERKSPKQIEIDKLEADMVDLQKRIDELKEKLQW